jgi:hypothetical protein
MCFGRRFTNSKTFAMSTPSVPPSPTPAGDNRTAATSDQKAIAVLSLEDRLQIFWEKNRTAIYAVVALVFLAILAKGGWEYLAEQRERGIQQAYAAATTPAQVKAFVAEHSDHPLAGVAQLRTADEAYADRRFAEAIAPYEAAAKVLETGALATRARLGLAMAKLQGGQAAEGEAALKALAEDANEIKAYRAEAAYHLASLAASKGNATDVQAFSDLLTKIDPESPWTQRVLQLRASFPAAAAPASVPAAGEDDAAPAIKLPSTK